MNVSVVTVYRRRVGISRRALRNVDDSRNPVKGVFRPMSAFSEKLQEAAGGDPNAEVYRKLKDFFGEERHKKDTVNNYMTGKTEKIDPEFIRDFCIVYRVNPAWMLADRLPKEWDPEGEEREDRKTVASWLDAFADGLRRLDTEDEIRLTPDVVLRKLEAEAVEEEDDDDGPIPEEPDLEPLEVNEGDEPEVREAQEGESNGT